jgi:hypothetical protein
MFLPCMLLATRMQDGKTWAPGRLWTTQPWRHTCRHERLWQDEGSYPLVRCWGLWSLDSTIPLQRPGALVRTPRQHGATGTVCTTAPSDRLVQGCGAGHWQASGRSRRVPGYISWYADSSSLDVVRSYRPTMLASALDDDAFGWPIVHHTWISAANCSTDEARHSFINGCLYIWDDSLICDRSRVLTLLL